MLSFPVLKVLDRTTKVLVDREEKGLGMGQLFEIFEEFSVWFRSGEGRWLESFTQFEICRNHGMSGVVDW